MRFLSFLASRRRRSLLTIHIAIPGFTGWIKPYDFVFTWAQPLAVLWIMAMTGVNYLGVRLGGAVQVFLTSIKIMSVGNCDWSGVFFAGTGRTRARSVSGRPRAWVAGQSLARFWRRWRRRSGRTTDGKT